ncbi:Undecaprenyl pyrophosphate synthetase [Granulibacter bethesdensis]|nr:Undecaprenyl pyrophosphate synthetase [Granulibacter bethesdensis]
MWMTRWSKKKKTFGRSDGSVSGHPSLIFQKKTAHAPDLAPASTMETGVLSNGAAPLPVHIGIIMDGNGRWAAARGLPRIAGHRAGAQAVRRVVQAAIEARIGWLTLYAFSSENWRRPAGEVTDLTGLLRHYIRSEINELAENGVRLHIIGDRSRFSQDIQNDLAQAERRTAGNTVLHLVIALSYGARAEIINAVRSAAKALAAGHMVPEALDETLFSSFLSTAGMPDPDLIIRTSGERRLSNFLLWQAAYAELVFMDVLWPDFASVHFQQALAEFGRRERRFGARPL